MLEPLQPQTQTEQIETVLALLGSEILAATKQHPTYHSAHEAYAILLEEVVEVQSEVFTKHRRPDLLAKELLHVATVAVRAVVDLGLLPQIEDESGSTAGGTQ